MTFNYRWQNKEANFGPPLENQVPGGMHLTFEIILKKDNKYVALRRPAGIPEHELPPSAKNYPNGLLYFCHDLIRYGESVEDCIRRIVKSQSGTDVDSFKVVYIDSLIQDKDNSWAFTPHVIATITDTPKTTSDITEVVIFGNEAIPKDFAWWEHNDLKEFLDEYDN